MDVAGFLAQFPPFDELPADVVERVAGAVRVERYAASETILQQGGEPAHALCVVRNGAVELLDDDVRLDVLGEGEVFGQLSLLTEERPSLTVRAYEDTECYLIPAEVAEELLATELGRGFVLGSLRRRIHVLAEHVHNEALGVRYRTVGSLVRRAPVTCPEDTSLADAAALMATEHVSSLLIPMRSAWGIVTDRDLRTKVVAARLDVDGPVGSVATFPVRTMPADAMAGEVLLEMFASDVHHIPVVGEEGALLGIVTDTDLMWLGRHTPFSLRSAIERAPSREEAIEAAAALPQVVVGLVEASADPVAVGHVVALVIDALTIRLLRLGMEELGQPGVPWAWVALGSAARHEQALRTDQDHALAFDFGEHPSDEVGASLGELAEFVTSGLEAAGIPRCKGDAMAVNPSLRRSVADWKKAFDRWMDDAGRGGSILTSIVFDYRQVAGPLEIEPAFDGAIRNARARGSFLHHLARRALDATPPTGFFREFVVDRGEHAGTLDVKRRGITIVGSLARVHAVRAGITHARTVDRLRACADSGELRASDAQDLEEAFRFLWEVRLRHQAEQVRAGEAADDFIDPARLGPVARRGLREAFRVVRRAQQGLAAEFGIRAASL
ncbi:MAG TPA: putative nucleotidyltransferase substrate binding domain-containing protein [Actinomycetota bacterium]|jgi:CBS domain-containing protein